MRKMVGGYTVVQFARIMETGLSRYPQSCGSGMGLSRFWLNGRRSRRLLKCV
jgi:hypothetical protein